MTEITIVFMSGLAIGGFGTLILIFLIVACAPANAKQKEENGR